MIADINDHDARREKYIRDGLEYRCRLLGRVEYLWLASGVGDNEQLQQMIVSVQPRYPMVKTFF
jgi:hypothetical protein